MTSGCEWVVDAAGCDAHSLISLPALQSLFADMVEDLTLHPLAEAHWHRFPGAGGITGALLLTESHLAVHTFPEYGSLCLNLFCCKPRETWAFEDQLRRRFNAQTVQVRLLERTTV
jgi:S-adenosylmethionine decarboxylase